MNITYTGQAAFTPPQQKKFEAKLNKTGKLLDREGDKVARVIITNERKKNRVEITVNYYDHALVSIGAGHDLLQAGLEALDKLEKQILKQRDKWRDTNRRPAAKAMRTPAAPSFVATASKPAGGNGKKTGAAVTASTKAVFKSRPPAAKPPAPASRIYRVDHRSSHRKPMTVDEALMEMTDGQNYVIFRDAGTERTNILVRRDDGHFDLIEG